MVTFNDEDIRYLKDIGKKIKKLREQLGMSQENLSFIAGIHRTYLSDLEQGNRNPSIITLLMISKALNISICELVEIDIDNL